MAIYYIIFNEEVKFVFWHSNLSLFSKHSFYIHKVDYIQEMKGNSAKKNKEQREERNFW